MALYIIDGKIGSGKTYFAVRHIINNYCEWCDVKFIFKLKDDVVLYTNIEDFKIGLSLDEAIEEAGGLNPFFTIAYQEEHFKNVRAIFMIDEAQESKWFPKTFKDGEVMDYLGRLRRLGKDMYLITNNLKRLHPEVKELPENHYHAVQRALCPPGRFRYRVIASGERVKSFIVKKEQRIFKFYKSQDVKELEKVDNALLRQAVIFGVICCFLSLCIFGVYSMMESKITQASPVIPAQTKKREVRVKSRPLNFDSKPVKKEVYTISKVKSYVIQGYGNTGVGVYISIEGEKLFNMLTFKDRFGKSVKLLNGDLFINGRAYEAGESFRL